MRLLQLGVSGEIVPPEDLVGVTPPPYAILSHTWGKQGDEVSYQDLVNKTAQGKAGYDKLKFCGEQAGRHGLSRFWVDTCCINKTNSTELQEAINSMFMWYQRAAKCYVYLADLSVTSYDAGDGSNERPWEAAFCSSRWFTRGWTLQELIAPPAVEFFSKEGTYLGNKNTLESLITKVTRIPAKALRGGALAEFSVSERMAWAQSRQTTREEDMSYSLIGVFGVSMPLIYGEGGATAARRLRASIDDAAKGKQCSVAITSHAHNVCRDKQG